MVVRIYAGIVFTNHTHHTQKFKSQKLYHKSIFMIDLTWASALEIIILNFLDQSKGTFGVAWTKKTHKQTLESLVI